MIKYMVDHIIDEVLHYDYDRLSNKEQDIEDWAWRVRDM
jgi:hypothetical protein